MHCKLSGWIGLGWIVPGWGEVKVSNDANNPHIWQNVPTSPDLIFMPWHRNGHVLYVLQEVFDPVQPGNDNNFSKSKVEDGVGGVVVEQAEHEDAGGKAAGKTSKEGKDATEWNVGHPSVSFLKDIKSDW